ncbi:MAG: hypothetical protein ACKVQA_26405 [Burkholderiales bacterium]
MLMQAASAMLGVMRSSPQAWPSCALGLQVRLLHPAAAHALQLAAGVAMPPAATAALTQLQLQAAELLDLKDESPE